MDGQTAAFISTQVKERWGKVKNEPYWSEINTEASISKTKLRQKERKQKSNNKQNEKRADRQADKLQSKVSFNKLSDTQACTRRFP